MYLAPLNYDMFFKKVFSDERISKRFLEDFLDVTIEEFEMLKGKHRITDDASVVEFDFRCKIDNSYVIIDMQQWYKQDIIQRFYVYHAVNTGLQLESLPLKYMTVESAPGQARKIKDYKSLEPVLTLIWMAVDQLGFSYDYVGYIMTPEAVLDFIKKEKLWHNANIVELIEERNRILEMAENNTKELGFLGKNRLVFALQHNIVKNKKLEKYVRWFEFAEKTRHGNNKKEDFQEYEGDEIFLEMMKRLNREDLKEEDFVYIEKEKEFWEGVERFERGIYKEAFGIGLKEGIKEGIKEGLKEGEKKGLKEGKQEGIAEGILTVARAMKENKVDSDVIMKTTGLAREVIETL
ncbi:MAG: hypothetical protein NT166_30700 [Candidatus Aminicenantes bacterium]|nr:hypothetical protein [Candidatus Aminicenantes bacterium]